MVEYWFVAPKMRVRSSLLTLTNFFLMYFFPVEIFFHLNFNAYFFTSVSTSFYFRSFQPRFYEFIKFRFSKLTTSFVDFNRFNKFRDLIFPTTFFNPTRFTSQFYWFTLETSNFFIRPTWLNFPTYDKITYRAMKSLTFHTFFDDDQTTLPFFIHDFADDYQSDTKIHYFDSKFFLTDFRKQNSFFFDFSFFHKFDTVFATRFVKSLFKRLNFATYLFNFNFLPSAHFSNILLADSFHSLSINNRSFNISKFFYASFFKFLIFSSYRFRNVESDFKKLSKKYQFLSEFRGKIYRSDWPFERARRNRFFISQSPLLQLKYKKFKHINSFFALCKLLNKKEKVKFFYRKKIPVFNNIRNPRFFFYSNTTFALSSFYFFKNILFKYYASIGFF
jgi:hypothetical protein